MSEEHTYAEKEFNRLMAFFGIDHSIASYRAL